MADEIYFHTTSEAGYKLRGSYRQRGNSLMITTIGGKTSRVERDARLSEEEQAKFVLRGMDRKSRGKF